MRYIFKFKVYFQICNPNYLIINHSNRLLEMAKWVGPDGPARQPDKKPRAGSRNSTRQPNTARPVKPAGPSGQPVGQNGPARGPYQLIKKMARAYFSIPHTHTLCLRSPPTHPPNLSLRALSLFAISILRARFSSTDVAAGHRETHRPPRRRR